MEKLMRSFRLSKKMEWSRDDVHKLIQFYVYNPCLWLSDHEDYRNEAKKQAALKTIADQLNTSTAEVLRKLRKIKSETNQRYNLKAIFHPRDLAYIASQPRESFYETEQEKAEREERERKAEEALNPEIPVPPQVPTVGPPKDEEQVFGDYVASVLRNSSTRGNQTLRKLIQKAIVRIQEQEDEITSQHGI